MPENNSVDIKFDSTNNGTVYFAPDVLATIAGLALMEVDGIEKRKGKAVNIKNVTRGLKVDVKDEQVSVSVTVVVEYGYPVQDVCRDIQESIKKTIETMTGMTVKNVDVHVTGLSFAKENREAAELEYKSYLLGQREDESADGEDAQDSPEAPEE